MVKEDRETAKRYKIIKNMHDKCNKHFTIIKEYEQEKNMINKIEEVSGYVEAIREIDTQETLV